MCGIAGFLSAHRPPDDAAGVLTRLRQTLAHRGPDDHGEFLSEDRCCGLTNARLAILDLSAAGHQPMRSADGRYVIVFNGEIYNFLELRAELEAGGAVFRSRSDTEVVLQLYERHGAACVDRLRGMFALAVWDERERTCFLARDPLGIKPLYYYHDDPRGLLVFSSELRSLLATGLVPRQLDPQGMYGYFRSGSVPEPLTMIAGVRCLEPGTRMHWQNGQITRERFWSLGFSPENGEARDPADTVRAALLESVEQHFVSDVNVGLFLSGGIDSTAVLALARANGRENIRTFSIGFADDAAADESPIARRTAEHFGAQHAEWRLDRVSGRALFDDFLPHVDQPSVDGFNTFAVSRFTREQGIKVALSGLGGDELFGGYPSFRQLPRMIAWSRRLGPVRGVAGRALAAWAPRPSLRRLGDFLQQPPTLANAYAAYRGIHTDAEARALVAGFTDAGHCAGPITPEASGSEYPTDADEISALEIRCYMSNQLLRDSDVMSMANGLELRVPLVDRRVVETLARIPAWQRLVAGKGLLLRAVPEVPDWVAGQPKRGFLFPFETWMAGDWGSADLTSTNVAARRQAPRTWYQKWSVFVFEHWWRHISS